MCVKNNMKISAGIVLYKIKDKQAEFFLVHNGGPFFKNKDNGYWSIPKGELEEGETSDDEIFKRAITEVKEETGIELLADRREYFYLGTIKQKNNKLVHAWAQEFSWQGLLKQNIITIEYPYQSRKFIKIPEVDRAEYFQEKIAKEKINPAQIPFIERVKERLGKSKKQCATHTFRCGFVAGTCF